MPACYNVRKYRVPLDASTLKTPGHLKHFKHFKKGLEMSKLKRYFIIASSVEAEKKVKV